MLLSWHSEESGDRIETVMLGEATGEKNKDDRLCSPSACRLRNNIRSAKGIDMIHAQAEQPYRACLQHSPAIHRQMLRIADRHAEFSENISLTARPQFHPLGHADRIIVLVVTCKALCCQPLPPCNGRSQQIVTLSPKRHPADGPGFHGALTECRTEQRFRPEPIPGLPFRP